MLALALKLAGGADSLEFERKYTSAVIAWAPDDRPTDAQIEAVLDEFEKTARAGLEPGRYSWMAVLHRERGGGVHVQVLAAQCDLETGRSLTLRRPAGRRPSTRYATPSTASTAGAGRTTRREPGRSNRAIAPTSRREGCGRGSSSRPTIEPRIETLAAVNVDIEQARETLAHLKEATWRVRLLEIDGERYVVLPAGTLDYPPWTVGGRPAVKLSSE